MRRDATSEDGATMVEYGLMLIGIAVAATFAVNAFGGRVLNLFVGIFP